MVRRSTVERSPHSAEHGLAHDAGTEYSEPDAIVRSRPARTWGGAGGRWLVWLFRSIAWAVLLLIGFRGVMAILSSETSSGPAATPAAPATRVVSFPVSLADAYALQFAQVYLNYSPADAARRASQLSAFLPPGSDPQLGWSGTGSSQLQSEQVAGTDVRDAHHAIVTLLARVNGQLMQLGVPIYAASGALVVTGAPAWLPAPARAALPTAPPAGTDPATQAQLGSQLLHDFFTAYASGDQEALSRDLAPGTSLTGLNGAVVFRSLAGLTVPPGGATRHIIATVAWSVPPRKANGQAARGAAAQLTMSYALTVVKRSGTWYVSGISAANDSPGAP